MVRSTLTSLSIGVALTFLLVGTAELSGALLIADEFEGYLQIARPLDVPSERLERPRPEQDRLYRSQPKAALRQAEVIALAKAAAKKELGKSIDDYELKAVVFDPTAKTWSVTFDPKPPRRSSEACVIVLVHDDTKDTDLSRCS
jgi:hypothetical protein